MKKENIIVGLSGGVDSAVTAWILKNQGHNVSALFMKNWEDDDDDEYCSSKQDLIDAVAVAEKIGIEIEVVNFAKEYKEKVFSLFIDGLENGLTPNPDILCNSEIKFDAFLRHAVSMGAEKIATGHYAKVLEEEGLFHLLKGDDGSKDQSYFLHRLNQNQLSKSIFPLGSLLKKEVREIAKDNKLHNYNRKDSTGICFIGERPFAEFISNYIKKQPGKIVDDGDNILGNHDGLNFYTIGQRQGLKIGGIKKGNGEPWFVIHKDYDSNRLVVGQGHNHPRLFSKGLVGNQLHLVDRTDLVEPIKCTVKTRYRQEDVICHLSPMANDEYLVMFEQEQSSVTPGQSVVQPV